MHFHRGKAPLAQGRACASLLSPLWGHCRAPKPPPRGAHDRMESFNHFERAPLAPGRQFLRPRFHQVRQGRLKEIGAQVQVIDALQLLAKLLGG